MAYELKPNTGSVFKNMKKEKDTHPDLKGDALIDGKMYWVSGWKKTDKNNNTWISFAVTEKTDKPVMDNTPAARDDVLDSDIPF